MAETSSSPSTDLTQPKTVVVVTGASGFVGSHVVASLLKRGVHVRGTVRNATNEAKTQFLRELAAKEESTGTLELFSADLTKPDAFDEAITGADIVVHTAAAVILNARDPQREIVDVTVNGLENVIESCKKASKHAERPLRRFVMTSSIAAIMDQDKPADHIYTEDDWNTTVTLKQDAYSLSKYLAEKRATELLEEFASQGGQLSWCFINPGIIYGPILAKHQMTGSAVVIHDLMTGKFPMIPDLAFPAIDVRDVADAHVIAALDKPEAEGRFICVDKTITFKDISLHLREAYPNYKFPRRRLPNFLMYVTAVFDKRVTFNFLKNNLGIYRQVSSERLKRELGMELRDVMDRSLNDTAESLLDLGIVARKD